MLGLIVAFSIVAPSFQAGDHQGAWNRQRRDRICISEYPAEFSRRLLLLWAEPFRVGDQIKLDSFEGTVEDIQLRATTIKTYDGKRVVIPNAELFTHSVTVNTAFESRRWEYEFSVNAADDLVSLKTLLVRAVAKVDGVLSTPQPEALVTDLGDPSSGIIKLRLTWWTQSPLQREMIASHDRVLTLFENRCDDYQLISPKMPSLAPPETRSDCGRQRSTQVRRTGPRSVRDPEGTNARNVGSPASVIQPRRRSHQDVPRFVLFLITHDLLASFRKKKHAMNSPSLDLI